ncbi:hypothetical protein D5F01_LYC16568 [Larimichthys crocea]|uniref:Uncharacterized protein n=1 Tax=Larimichthys crocea TaxID=215358 RepID=A0A6G0I120_LARCR|nr:hypothetical protein D5F01_LYC16568 [Larimichthys crocea]
MIFSETRILTSGVIQSLGTSVLLFAFGNDVSPLTMNAFEMCDISGEKEPQVEHASLSVVLRVLKAEMPKKDRISPVRNTYLAHPLPFLPVLLTPILSVRSVILLGRRKKERCRTRRQEAEGPLRRSRGQHLILPRYGQSSVKVRSAGPATQPPLLGRWRKVRTLPLSIFCMAWFIGF